MWQRKELTPTQEAMLEHMAYLNFSEDKPACWRDFALFEVNGKQYRLKHGTIKNNFWYLKHKRRIKLIFRSINSYYALTECMMTSDHTSVISPETDVINNNTRQTTTKNKDLIALIDDMPFDTPALHNIRLVFPCNGIWDRLSNSRCGSATQLPTTTTNRKRSKDLALPAIKLEQGVKALLTIHKTNNVTVILDCSESPIMLNPHGLILLNRSLVHVQERLRAIIYSQGIEVPEPTDWFVTMQHYGRDSLQQYRGKSFDITIKEYNGEFLHTYFKKSNNCIRVERQELPREKLADVLRRKLLSS